MYSKSNRKRLSKRNRKRLSKSLPNIPTEIIIEILLRLPVKSLLRFRCVSKLWRSSISHPKFTLDYSSRTHRLGKIAVRPGPGLLDGEVYSVDCCNAVYSSSSCVELLINEKNKKWFQLLGSCNGLLLVSHYTNLYLWNPATRQCTKMLSLRYNDYVIRQEISASSGLCYDSTADDYKAVMVYDGKVSVASFRRRIWATTACCFADGGEKLMNSGPVVNGKLYWVINQTGIAYFDPITDEFVELPAPTQRKTVILGLGVLEGCLCMAQGGCESGAEFEPSLIEVFVMREYGLGESWRSIFIMSNVELSRPYEYGNLVPLCFTKNGEVFILVNRNKLFVYNPNEMSRREIPIPNHRYELHVASYMESLASPNDYGHEEDWIETGEDALELVEYFWYYDCCSWDSHDRDLELLNITLMEGADEEDDNWVWEEFWKKEENQEKFTRRYKARLYFLAAKEKKQKRRSRIKTESEKTPPRKNKKDRKHGKNLELDDLHKQVLDFVVK